jgi:NAD(P)-dependent dehydrogenase (short-subunit alcohol dehydrogenase family)
MRDSSSDKTADQEHVVLIAGDLAGTARAAAFAYASKGNHIVVASVDDAAGLKLTEEIRSRNIDAEFVHADAGNRAELRNVIDRAVEHYGHLDVQYLPRS